MKHTLFGLFTDSKHAGEAVAELKSKGYAKDISLVSKNEENMDADVHQVKEDVTEGATAGAVIGGALGALTGIIVGLSAVVLPGIGPIVIGGPLAAAWGITGGALGALTGGLVGALVDLGVPEETAKAYEDRIMQGEVLVAVSTEHDKEAVVEQILKAHGADSSALVHVGE